MFLRLFLQAEAQQKALITQREFSRLEARQQGQHPNHLNHQQPLRAHPQPGSQAPNGYQNGVHASAQQQQLQRAGSVPHGAAQPRAKQSSPVIVIDDDDEEEMPMRAGPASGRPGSSQPGLPAPAPAAANGSLRPSPYAPGSQQQGTSSGADVGAASNGRKRGFGSLLDGGDEQGLAGQRDAKRLSFGQGLNAMASIPGAGGAGGLAYGMGNGPAVAAGAAAAAAAIKRESNGAGAGLGQVQGQATGNGLSQPAAKRPVPAEVIEILDSDEEEEARVKAGAAGRVPNQATHGAGLGNSGQIRQPHGLQPHQPVEGVRHAGEPAGVAGLHGGGTSAHVLPSSLQRPGVNAGRVQDGLGIKQERQQQQPLGMGVGAAFFGGGQVGPAAGGAYGAAGLMAQYGGQANGAVKQEHGVYGAAANGGGGYGNGGSAQGNGFSFEDLLQKDRLQAQV